MGLDMYLTGETLIRNRPLDGDRLGTKKGESFDLGYWRKHPNLHGYIVEEFAHGVDECQEIHLTIDDMHQIIDAVKNTKLPFTEGFFFGKSYGTPEDNKEDIRIFEHAIKWLESEDKTAWRWVFYKASW